MLAEQTLWDPKFDGMVGVVVFVGFLIVLMAIGFVAGRSSKR